MTRWAVAAASTVREERAELAAVQAEIAEGRRDGGAEPAALLARHSALEERIRRGIWFRGASGAGSGRAVTARELHPGSTAGRCVVRRHGGELFAVVLQAGRSRLVCLGSEEPMRFEADTLLFALRRMIRSGPTMTCNTPPLRIECPMFNSRFQALLATALSALVLALPTCSGNSGAGELHRVDKKQNAQPVIWIGDFNNFDDAVALMLVAKDPRYRLELIVVEESFNTVAQGANTVFNILEWLGNLDTEVIRGAYYSRDEVTLGANGVEAKGTRVDDVNSVPGQPDYQLPNSAANERFNLERRNVVGTNIYGQFVPGPWRDNGATLYNTDHLIPRATQDQYHYQGNRGTAFDFKLAENIILDRLSQVDRKVVVLSTGKLTTLARMLAKGSEAELDKIGQVVMMGGGFQGLEPFTAGHPAACFGDKSLNLGGNIFSHPIFNCDTDFSTHQEFNILLDPTSAEQTFDLLSEKRIEATLIPTNATDNAKIQLASIGALAAPGGTPESCYTSKLFAAIRTFEGGDFNGSGDFALDAVIRLWDIIAALVVLDPQLITETTNAYVDVDQLNPGLAASATPYDPITFDPTVGKTTLNKDGTGQQLRVVIAVDTDAARQAMINRLRDGFNAAVHGDRCGGAG